MTDPETDPLTDPLEAYAHREAEASRSADFWRARFDSLANQRMGVTLALAAGVVGYLTVPGARTVLIAATLILSAIFVMLVVKHARVRHQEIWYRQLAQVALEAGHRRLRRWEEFAEPAIV